MAQFGSLLIVGALLFLPACSAGYVTTQPADVVYDHGLAPGAGYIWIDGDWIWSGGQYRRHEGHRGRPRGGRTWQRGNWSHFNNGYRWNRGHWK
ncbi:MAG: hypothetical protein P4L51_22855 [Puia sp.]|nr:hypothetical protein [Puia sp.]